MVIDYSERRQSQRIQQPKRPARPSVWPYALVILAMLIITFLAGVGSGWYLFRPGGRFCKIPVQPPAQVGKPAPQPQAQPAPAATAPGQPAPQQPLNALPAAEKGAPVPPLTFYKTLQQGNKELMGTGINQPKEGQGGAVKPVPQSPAER
jgi:hypothetical protein